MADNTRGGSQDGSDPLIATDEVTYSGDTADVQLVRVVGVTGSEGSKTVVNPEINADWLAPLAMVATVDSPADGAGDNGRASLMHDGAESYGPLNVAPAVYNGSTWDRLRGDTLGLHISRHATAATATLSNVASSASSVTLLSANTSRKGATIHNDSTQIVYVKFGTTASATSYTVKMVADAYYEVPFGYTGRIDGIWASANGNARITEMT
jgi:hypothetical protein